MSFDFSGITPVARYSEIAGQHARAVQPQVRVHLVPTDEPVWPEDERRDEKLLLSQGIRVELAPPADQPQVLSKVRVDLPDRLIWVPLKNTAFDTPGYDLYGFKMPISFSAPDDIIPRRLKLSLALSLQDLRGSLYDAGNVVDVPIVVWMFPETDVDVEKQPIAKVGVDTAKALQALEPFLPFAGFAGDVFTASTSLTIERDRITRRILATGLNRSECDWRIADKKISYDFRPRVIAQVPLGHRLAVKAQPHVEVQKRFVFVFRKTYGKTPEPREYVYDGKLYDADGNEITSYYGREKIVAHGGARQSPAGKARKSPARKAAPPEVKKPNQWTSFWQALKRFLGAETDAAADPTMASPLSQGASRHWARIEEPGRHVDSEPERSPDNARYAVEPPPNTKARPTAQVWQHGNCPVRHRTPEAAARCRNR